MQFAFEQIISVEVAELENGDALNLESIRQAAAAALCSNIEEAADAILRAANEMPHDASDFDCGLAAGLALARYLEQSVKTDQVGTKMAGTSPS